MCREDGDLVSAAAATPKAVCDWRPQWQHVGGQILGNYELPFVFATLTSEFLVPEPFPTGATRFLD